MIIPTTLVQQWSIRQLDVQIAFLYSLIFEDVYMEQPLGMKNP